MACWGKYLAIESGQEESEIYSSVDASLSIPKSLLKDI